MVVITCNDCNEGDATWVKNAEQGKQICDIITIQSDCTFKNHSEDDTYQKAICLIQRWNKRYIPEQNTFEEIPEIESIIEDYYKPQKTYHVNFQCSVLYGYGLTKEDAEKKRDEWNAGKDYDPPAAVFEDRSDFPNLHLEAFDDEFKMLLRDYINRKKRNAPV